MADLVPANGQPVQITMPDGTQAWVPPQYAGDIIRMLSGGGRAGGGGLTSMVDAGAAIFEGFSADTVRRQAKRARKKRRELEDLQAEYFKIQPTASGERDLKLKEIWDKQRDLDRAQTRALETGYKGMIVSALANGVRAIAPSRGGGGLSMGFDNQGLFAGLAGVSVGALLFKDDSDDDDDDED